MGRSSPITGGKCLTLKISPLDRSIWRGEGALQDAGADYKEDDDSDDEEGDPESESDLLTE